MGDKPRGLLILYVGGGKGKTSAALGTLLRAWGHGLRVGVIQFIKGAEWRSGEALAAERLGIPWRIVGEGFVYDPARDESARRSALAGWALAQEWIASGAYDLLVLDEFTYLFSFGWLSEAEAVAWIRAHRPPALHLVITGHEVPPVLLEAADLVTEMRAVKHPYEAGIPAQKGIEF